MTDQPRPACGTEQMEADVTAVIDACGGDARTAIKALLIEQLLQEQRIERLAAALSVRLRPRTDRRHAAPVQFQPS